MVILMKVRIGELNKRIEIITTENSHDDEGFPISQEVTLYRPWAKITHVSGSEIYKSNSDFARSSTRFLIRYRADLKEEHKIKYKNNLYNIKYINNYKEEDRFIEILAELVK